MVRIARKPRTFYACVWSGPYYAPQVGLSVTDNKDALSPDCLSPVIEVEARTAKEARAKAKERLGEKWKAEVKKSKERRRRGPEVRIDPAEEKGFRKEFKHGPEVMVDEQ